MARARRTYTIQFNDGFYVPESEKADWVAPASKADYWRFCGFWEIKNRTALAMAGFIAKHNRMKLVPVDPPKP